MSTLVADLKNEHAELRRVLERVKELGIGTEEGRRELLQARALFQAHIAHEDQAFYPAFHRMADGSKEAATATQFSSEMSQVSRDILAFFDRYRNGGEGIEFARDFGRLYATLFARWNKEENILYAAYERMATS